MKARIAIIGAGPIGIEAALRASVDGYEVAVYERDCVGANLLDWGHVTLFSPWAMNVSPLGLAVLGRLEAPRAEDLLTGRQMVETYLEPLSKTSELRGKIFENTHVVQVGRDRLIKTDLIGDPLRGRHAFRLLLSERDGRERVAEADIVIDASGVWGNQNYCGNGSIPAPGERRHADRISYRIENFANPAMEARYAGKRVLVVGGGHSAATTVCGLADLFGRKPSTQAVWATRRRGPRPLAELPDDALPYRAEIVTRANVIAERRQGVEHRMALVEAIASGKERALRVTLRGERGTTDEEFDYIIANCGFGPDNSLYRELQFHECYATRGPMKLAGALLGSATADCLAEVSHGDESLINPEPGFFVIGIKSYGKLSNFLLKIGREQIESVFRLLEKGEFAAASCR